MRVWIFLQVFEVDQARSMNNLNVLNFQGFKPKQIIYSTIITLPLYDI